MVHTKGALMLLKVAKVDDELFRKVKAQAVLEDKTLREYVIEAITEKLARSQKKAVKV